MTIIRVLWYLCGLFILAALFSSAMTVVPEMEYKRNIGCIILLVLAGISGVAAGGMKVRWKRTPSDAFLSSKFHARIAVGVAVILTIIVLLVSVG
jgi:hypothetical protein